MIPKILLLLFFLSVASGVRAFYDPLSVPNNSYGIHIADTNNLKDVPELVNSSGGDWGYVTLVITEEERDTARWQKIFDDMRRMHLIPIVRLATRLNGEYWEKPDDKTFDIWVSFLSSLNWPVENRYVVLYNEPNHAKEWGNTLAPEEYGEVFIRFADKLKASSEDFFVLPAGMDASAPSNSTSLDESEFLERMFSTNPGIADRMDGWTSHSYPNPAFSGLPYSWGKGTVRTYAWELEYLKLLGQKGDLPVFITETGWVHSEGKTPDFNLPSQETVSSYIQQAAAVVWTDSRIAAVTPFVFSYLDVPFDHFSWKKLGTETYYDQYFAYQKLQKVQGKPQQHHRYTFEEPLLPIRLVADSLYTFQTKITNDGQAILNQKDYMLALTNPSGKFLLHSYTLPSIEPKQTGNMSVHMTTPQNPGAYRVELVLKNGSIVVPLLSRSITIIPQPSVSLTMQLGWKKTFSSEGVAASLYDANGLLVHTIPNATIVNSTLTIEHLRNILPGREYRLKIIIPYCLPVQKNIVLTSGQNITKMPRAFALDTNNDTRFSGSDIAGFFTTNPDELKNRFFGN